MKDSESCAEGQGSYFRTNHPDFDSEVLHDMSHTFQEIADSAGLLESDIYEVWNAWTGQKDLCTFNHAAKALQKKYTVLLYSDSNQIAKHHGAGGDSFPRSPSQVGWPLVLPMVCQGKAK